MLTIELKMKLLFTIFFLSLSPNNFYGGEVKGRGQIWEGGGRKGATMSNIQKTQINHDPE